VSSRSAGRCSASIVTVVVDAPPRADRLTTWDRSFGSPEAHHWQKMGWDEAPRQFSGQSWHFIGNVDAHPNPSVGKSERSIVSGRFNARGDRPIRDWNPGNPLVR
jgi:hypothetical protein